MITVLDKAVSELIAAGEVIERPSSVIKELIENSIDAGARHITVEIKNGGSSYMRITDDGCGIPSDEVSTAFLRHATSKIVKKDDLDAINTLGFRGEALASVAAVARIMLLTKTRDSELGTRYEIAGDTTGTLEEAGCPNGTTLIVRDLFFNVPVRRKFLKRDSTEGNAVAQIVQKIAISHPHIAFTFLRDNTLAFQSDGNGSLLAAIHAVHGKDFAGDLIPVDHVQNGIHVHGFTIKPLYAKKNRSLQTFFVNNRFVRSRICSIGLESAYENLLMVGKYPACILLIDMPPATLDVNIHPAKAEVRFSDERSVIQAIYFAVKNALLQAGLLYEFQMPQSQTDWYAQPPREYEQTALPNEMYTEPRGNVTPPSQVSYQASTVHPPIGNQYVLREESIPSPPSLERHNPMRSSLGNPIDVLLPRQDSPQMVQDDVQRKCEIEDPIHRQATTISTPSLSPISKPIPENPESEKHSVRVIGEVFENYIVAESGSTMFLIDKHAAHERVIFERLRKANCKQYEQILLSPCRVLLTLDECSVMSENIVTLERLGFSFDFRESPYVICLSAPSFFEVLNLDDVIQEIAHNLFLGKMNPQTHQLDDMLHELACKSAIRAGDINSIQELQALCEEVLSNPDIRHCPHGRPVCFTLTQYQLERQFKRRV